MDDKSICKLTAHLTNWFILKLTPLPHGCGQKLRIGAFTNFAQIFVLELFYLAVNFCMKKFKSATSIQMKN